MMHPRLQQHFGPQWRPNPCNHRFEGWNEALSHALDGLERQTTGQKCSTHRALSRCVVRFKLRSKKDDAQDCPSRPGRFRISTQFVCHRARVAATHEEKPRPATNPAQWLPLSKAVPARRFFRGGTRKTPDFPLISTLRRKIFAAALNGAALVVTGGKGGGGRG